MYRKSFNVFTYVSFCKNYALSCFRDETNPYREIFFFLLSTFRSIQHIHISVTHFINKTKYLTTNNSARNLLEKETRFRRTHDTCLLDGGKRSTDLFIATMTTT